MSTLAVVEEILRETSVPMSVREIVERAGVRLPSKSKTPDTVVARDLSMDIKKKGEASLFTRTSPGRYTLRTLVPASVPAVAATTAAGAEHAPISNVAPASRPTPAAMPTMQPAMATRKPPVSAPIANAASSSSNTGGGYAG